MSDKTLRFALKPAIFALSLGPVAWLIWAALTNQLSANPLADLTNETGVWTLRFIALTLALTPLRRLTRWNAFARFRRMIGLFAFFYGTLHFLTYVIADRFAGLDFTQGILAWTTVRSLLRSVAEDIYKRPFITVGFLAWITMVPLAITSTAGMIRRLGGRRWSQLHRLVYATAVVGVLHYWWLVKADVSSPRIYAVVVVVLLAARVDWSRRSASIIRQLTDRRMTPAAAGRGGEIVIGAVMRTTRGRRTLSRRTEASKMVLGVLLGITALVGSSSAGQAPAVSMPDVQTLGPQVGSTVPGFSLSDQSGRTRTLPSIMGPKGAILVFFRSADW